MITAEAYCDPSLLHQYNLEINNVTERHCYQKGDQTLSKELNRRDRVLLAKKLKEMRLAHGYKQDEVISFTKFKRIT